MSVDHARLARVQQARRHLAETGPATIGSQGDFDRVALPLRDADTLRDLLVAEEVRVVIEIGLAYGSSALAIAEALTAAEAESTRHVVIDAHQDRFHDFGWNSLVAAGLHDVCTLLRERSQLALPRLVADGFVADAAFVDGSHLFHNVFVDLVFLRELVRPGGLIILDDCQWPSVAMAVDYFEINTDWRAEPTTSDSRLRAYRLPDPRTEPPFEAFQAFGPAAP